MVRRKMISRASSRTRRRADGSTPKESTRTSGRVDEGLWRIRRSRLSVRNGMMENMRRTAERGRKTRALRRRTPQRRYSGTKKAAHEKPERRNRPGVPSAGRTPANATMREMNVAAHNVASVPRRMRTAGG